MFVVWLSVFYVISSTFTGFIVKLNIGKYLYIGLCILFLGIAYLLTAILQQKTAKSRLICKHWSSEPTFVFVMVINCSFSLYCKNELFFIKMELIYQFLS